MKGVKNIVFDMGGVLVDLDRSACVRAFEQLGYAEAESLLDPYLQKGIFLELERGAITATQFCNVLRENIEGEVTDQQICDAFYKFITGLPVAKLRMIHELKKRFKIYMLSNTNDIVLKRIDSELFTQDGLTVDDYFDYRYLSQRMNMLKPNDEIYLEMARHGNMKPEQTLFLDDSQANIDAAARLGFQTYLVKPNEDYSHIFASI